MLDERCQTQKSKTMYFYLYDIYKYRELTYSDNDQNNSCLSAGLNGMSMRKFGE